jgi:DNA-binding CsgD family transcriptional regulator
MGVKAKNVYNNYDWYLLDTVIIEIDESGFPLKTLITCTNINLFKKDESVYYNVTKKNQDGYYEVVLEGTEHGRPDQFKLTPRETQIINLIANGYTSKQIAHKLSISLNTALSHRKAILKKTKCTGVAELTNLAFSRGLL